MSKCTFRAVLAVCFCAAVSVGAGAGEIKNPYHKTTLWKLWAEDETPVSLRGVTVKPVPKDKRLYPDDADTSKNSKLILSYRDADWPGRKYAGFWDDVYASHDRRHSYVKPKWDDANGNSVSGIRERAICFVGGRHRDQMKAAGVNFTSQSTAGMGHDLANKSDRMFELERDFYFANVMRAGPAHASFLAIHTTKARDYYEALVPSFYNSMGSSGSETMAIAKMMIAGGYLPKEVKLNLKRHGIYPAACLYIWKASLPYDAPYDHELRHRVAYNSKGDHSDYVAATQSEVNHYYHNYDDPTHMRNMVNLAKSMKVAPPMAIFGETKVEGGKKIYTMRTSILVHQGAGETVKLSVNTGDSYDIQSLPLKLRWKGICGNQKTTIDDKGDGIYEITVPHDAKLPKGRTSILLIANNGAFDSNPAIVNVFRTSGHDNLRPSLTGLADRTILPGERVVYDIQTADPEGFPVKLYRWTGEVGSLSGGRFTWNCPADQADGDYPVSIIASDCTSGSAQNSDQAHIRVRSTIAEISADRAVGAGSLAVKFSSAGSRDKQASRLSYRWNFDDGEKSTEANPAHTFKTPGFYEVTLKVAGPSGSHVARCVITVKPDWPMAINNGWTHDKLDEAVWTPMTRTDAFQERYNKKNKIPATDWRKPTPDRPVAKIWRGVLKIEQKRNRRKEPVELYRLTSNADFVPPLYVEYVYNRPWCRSLNPTGINVLGTYFGSLPKPNDWPSMRSVAIGRPGIGVKAQPTRQHIDVKTKYQKSNDRVRMFIDKDPCHKGKFRYSGVLETLSGATFFRYDNQDIHGKKVEIVSGEAYDKHYVLRFSMWAPSGKAGGADIAVSGMGQDIFSRTNSPEMSRLCGADFGWPSSSAGTVTRTFTIRNQGSEALKLTGEKAPVVIAGPHGADFKVTTQPDRTIEPGASSSFVVTFKPTKVAPRKAEVKIASDDPNEKTVSFFVLGGPPADER